MSIQSLLFGRDAGWTESKAKAWAKSHGYKFGKVDVTDQYIRIRQFDPKGLKVKRTKTLGRGIRAVVAREEDMKRRNKVKTNKVRSTRRRARKVRSAAAPRTTRRVRSTTRVAAPRKRARRVRSTSVAAPRRRRHVRRTRETSRRVAAPRRRVRRVRASTTVAAPRRRRHRRARRARETVVAAPRRRTRRVRASTTVAAPRRRKRHTARAWHGNTPGHRKAAKKGHSRRRARRTTREATRVAAPRRRRARRHSARETAYVASPRRRRHKRRHAREATRTVRSNRRRSYRANAMSMRGVMSTAGKLALGIAATGLGFTMADWVDRYLATYNPAGDPAKLPKNKFTSDGAGTLANALNVASPPNLMRIGAVVGQIIVPAYVAMLVKNKYAKPILEGYALGAGVKAFSMLWSNVLMPMLAPKGEKATQEALQKSHIARLYPAEVAAKLNLETKTESVSSSGSGALSGSPDVGPFALAGSSPYPDAAQALRREAGISGDSPYPSAAQALREATGVLRDGDKTGVGYRPAAPIHDRWRGMHPGYARGAALSQRWGAFRVGSLPAGYHHHHCMARARVAYPTYSDAQLHAWCVARPYTTYPYLYEAPAQTVTYGPTGVGDDAPPPDAGGPGFTPAPPPPAPQPSAATSPPADPVGPPTFQPGPGSGPGPGPVALNQECGCVGDNNQFLGFIGDAEEKDVFFSAGK